MKKQGIHHEHERVGSLKRDVITTGIAVCAVVGAMFSKDIYCAIENRYGLEYPSRTVERVPYSDARSFTVVVASGRSELSEADPSVEAPAAIGITESVVYELNQMKPASVQEYSATYHDKVVMTSGNGDCIDAHSIIPKVISDVVNYDEHTVPIIVPAWGEKFCSLIINEGPNNNIGGVYNSVTGTIIIREGERVAGTIPHEIGHALGMQHSGNVIYFGADFLRSKSEYNGEYSVMGARDVRFASRESYYTTGRYADLYPEKYTIKEIDGKKGRFPLVKDGLPLGVLALPISSDHPINKENTAQQPWHVDTLYIGATGSPVSQDDAKRKYTDICKPVRARNWEAYASMKVTKVSETQSVDRIDVSLLDNSVPPHLHENPGDYVVYHDEYIGVAVIARVSDGDIEIDVVPLER